MLKEYGGTYVLVNIVAKNTMVDGCNNAEDVQDPDQVTPVDPDQVPDP